MPLCQAMSNAHQTASTQRSEDSTVTECFDLFVVPKSQRMRLSVEAVRHCLRLMAARCWIVGDEERVGADWAEIWVQPGHHAHGLFYEGEHRGERAFLEASMYHGNESRVIVDRDVFFYLAIRGTPHQSLAESFIETLHEQTWCHPQVLVAPHTGLPMRQEPEGSPVERRKARDRSSGLTGTRIEDR